MTTEGQEAESSCSPLEPSGDGGVTHSNHSYCHHSRSWQASPARHIPPTSTDSGRSKEASSGKATSHLWFWVLAWT